MIRLLLALHPRAWRADYGEELRDLLAAAPLTAVVALDVLRNAVRQHVRARPLTARLVVAVALSALVEVVAVRTHVTANILWPPSAPLRALLLGALVACWVPVARRIGARLRQRRAPLDDRQRTTTR